MREDMPVSECRFPVILLTGVNGQVGFELARSLTGLGKVVGVDREGMDLSNFDQVRRVVREARPSLIVNAAAYTDVDRAESDVDLAMRVNGDAPGVLAEESKRLGIPLIHYSTDYVFDGTKEGPYTEDDVPNPLNVYGVSKLAGERAIAASGCDFLIFRTSWIYGARGRNFLTTMLRLAEERDALDIVDDQIGAPTWAKTVAETTADVLAQSFHDGWWHERSGIYHLTAGGATSWFGFAKAIFETAAVRKVPVLRPMPAIAYPTPARRPGNSRLSNEKIEAVLGVSAPSWTDALGECVLGM